MTRLARKRFATLAVSACAGAVALTSVSTAQMPPVGPGPPGPLAPAIVEIEADWVPRNRVKLRVEAVPRGARVVRVVFRYRGRNFRAKHLGRFRYARTVKARGGDGRGDEIRFRVRACTATRCASRTGGDEAD